MRRFAWIFTSLVVALMVSYFAGPKVSFGELESPLISEPGISLTQLDEYVAQSEARFPHIKEGNRARVVWADSVPRKTRYSVVYLHGFSASAMEGYPVHTDFAKRYGFNLYLPRLAGHGIRKEEAFLHLTPNMLIESAKEAVAIGQLIGEDVILMSCSTGGTLSTYLAAANKELIDVLIMYSPNFALADENSKLLTGHWGIEVGRAIAGDYWSFNEEGDPEVDQYWTTRYRIEGLAALQALLESTMTKDVFNQISQPYFIGYYYKNEQEKDQTISIDAIKAFDRATSTSEKMKRLVAFSEAGAHVITSPITSKDVAGVTKATFDYVEKVLGIAPVKEGP